MPSDIITEMTQNEFQVLSERHYAIFINKHVLFKKPIDSCSIMENVHMNSYLENNSHGSPCMTFQTSVK
ncbi:hypothetical protein C922_05841, partial [Plasmodium inui San Antonio 1]